MIILACSATGGHVYPAIAVNEYLHGQSTYFVIDQGRISEDILKSYNYKYFALNFRRNKWVALGVSFFKLISFFYKHKPKLVLGFGGITTLAVVLAAKIFKVKTVLFEQNAVIGRTNRFLSYFVDQLWLSYPTINTSFCSKELLRGNPVRSRFIFSQVDRNILSLSFKKGTRCLIFGGSQGALQLNKFIESIYSWFEDNGIVVIHVFGDRDYEKKGYTSDYHVIKNDKNEVIRVEARFIQDMRAVYKWSDRVISRAGGTSIAELISYQKQALLVPFKYATDNHQYYNAKAFCKHGYGQIVLEKELSINHIDQFFKTTFEPQLKTFSYFNLWKETLDQELI